MATRASLVASEGLVAVRRRPFVGGEASITEGKPLFIEGGAFLVEGGAFLVPTRPFFDANGRLVADVVP